MFVVLCAVMCLLLLSIITSVVYWLKTLLLGECWGLAAETQSCSLLFECNRLDAFMYIFLSCHGSWASLLLCSWDKMLRKCKSVCMRECVWEWEGERESSEALAVERRKVLSAQQLVEGKWSELRREIHLLKINFSKSWQLKEKEPLHVEWNRNNILNFCCFFLGMLAQESCVAYFKFRYCRETQRKTTLDSAKSCQTQILQWASTYSLVCKWTHSSLFWLHSSALYVKLSNDWG